jgi:hypothetical protein
VQSYCDNMPSWTESSVLTSMYANWQSLHKDELSPFAHLTLTPQDPYPC